LRTGVFIRPLQESLPIRRPPGRTGRGARQTALLTQNFYLHTNHSEDLYKEKQSAKMKTEKPM
ncbi:hypothetical protein DXB25_00005, partial [Lachnospiraceae bacterium OM02-31]